MTTRAKLLWGIGAIGVIAAAALPMGSLVAQRAPETRVEKLEAAVHASQHCWPNDIRYSGRLDDKVDYIATCEHTPPYGTNWYIVTYYDDGRPIEVGRPMPMPGHSKRNLLAD